MILGSPLPVKYPWLSSNNAFFNSMPIHVLAIIYLVNKLSSIFPIALFIDLTFERVVHC